MSRRPRHVHLAVDALDLPWRYGSTTRRPLCRVGRDGAPLRTTTDLAKVTCPDCIARRVDRALACP